MSTLPCYHCSGTGILTLPEGSLGVMMRFIREKNGWTLRDVEKSTGISNAYLSQIEKGKVKNPSFEMVKLIAKHYGIKLNDIPESQGIN